MTRPQIIRADTIDLQDQEAPSAKDHSRHHLRPGLLGDGSPAPHQADALKNAELELSEQHGRSPRASQDLSGKELQLLHDEDVANDRDPNENLLRNSNIHGGGINTDDDMEGIEGDESLDDMMDKISSSPSIGEDGGYNLSLASAPPGFSTRSFHNTEPPREFSNEENSSSPFIETPAHLPLSVQHHSLQPALSASHHHHYHNCHEGLFTTYATNTISMVNQPESESLDDFSPTLSNFRESSSPHISEDIQNPHDSGFDPSDFENLLLPVNDPLLDSGYDETQSNDSSPSSTSANSDDSWQTHSEADDSNDGHDSDDDDDAATEVSFTEDPRFVDSGWGGECLRETEEIDFDFVYALHTFVATVEGQANATKGDNMVLLDDSNSYWWLVRVVKDSSIGYLPAEHIETPTERLARLNKHRNLDLSQAMLSDQEEDKRANPLNPLKKAMRRRNVKTVQFAPPSYLEPEEIVTTSDEEDDGNEEEFASEEHSTSQLNQEISDGVEENNLDESSKPREEQPLSTVDDHTSNQDLRNGASETDSATARPRTSEDAADQSDDGNLARSRKGNVRNTDSFFKDDSVETRKINLTPSLLRDDSSNNAPAKSTETTLKNRPSLDLIGKDSPAEKVKDEKKKKEKRGMLGGMFKRKDKKSKGSDREAEEAEKTSSDLARQSPQPKESMESLSQDTQTTKVSPQPHRQTSKLQKQPPAKVSPKSSYQQPKENIGQKNSVGQPDTAPIQLDTSKTASPSTELNGTSRLVTLDSQQRHLDESPLQIQAQHRDVAMTSTSPPRLTSDKDREEPRSVKEVAPVYPSSASKIESVVKDRNQSDDLNLASSVNEESVTTETSSEHESPKSSAEMSLSKPTTAQQHHLAIAQAAQYESLDVTGDELHKDSSRERLSESPVQVLPQEPRHQDPQLQTRATPHQPPPLIADTSSIEEPSTSSLRSSSSSPEPIERPSNVANASAESPKDDNDDEDREKSGSIREETLTTITPASSAPAEHPTPSSTSTTPTWSDASLRAYLDSDDGDIRDLLLVVHDKTGVKPRRDHPVVQSLYREENQKLDALSSNLDSLLGQYLARKKSGRKTDGVPPLR